MRSAPRMQDLDGVARTAYYCCGVRAKDARQKEPICGDHFAELFMAGEGQAVFDRFADLRIANAANATRTRIIDDWLRDRLLAEPDLRVILLGAGFDARAFRFGGGRWVEVDQDAIIAIKNDILPIARAPNPLERIAINFATEKLDDKLAPYENEHPVIVMEGVSMYLSPLQLKSTLFALRRVFPRHTLICDLVTKPFFERYGADIHSRIVELGGRFAELSEDPATIIKSAGYRQLARVSMMKRARELGAVPIPMLLLNTLLKTLRDGYCAYVFDSKK